MKFDFFRKDADTSFVRIHPHSVHLGGHGATLTGRFRFLEPVFENVCYIDGFNLYSRLLSGTPYKWLNLEVLLKSVLQPYHEIKRIKYFTARVSATAEDPSKTDRQDAYWRALMTSQLVIISAMKKCKESGSR